ncbi:hemicentin-1-like [Mercenaria mercenaria]|uniref:hemicentin-1-like n=1 Tax=Mercenaria mercenaria TaxID=6596 RepID=UPI00234E39CD|nr:hemicentin-1-like [Mercenaria mercenaria]
MGQFLTFLLTALLAAFVLCVSSTPGGRPSVSSETINVKYVTEGEDLHIMCNVTATGQILWSFGITAFEYGPLLNITNVTRKNTGIYTCSAVDKTDMKSTEERNIKKDIYSFFLNVLYPAKILLVNVSKTEFHLGGNFHMQVQVEGNPEPTTTYRSLVDGHLYFQHNGEGILNITIPSLNCTDNGQYELACKNSLANATAREKIVVLCPPEPVTGLKVSDVTIYSANLSFITGNDHNDTQTFYIMQEVDGNLTDFHRKKEDTPNDSGGKHVSLTINALNESTQYSLTVVSGNSRGNSTHFPNNVQFSTYGKPKPDPKFHTNTTLEPRLGDTVTLTAHAQGFPIPVFQWRHNGTSINSTNDNYTSTVLIREIVVNDFGKYTLNVTNNFGFYLEDYEILADGPPDPVSNLSVLDVNDTCAHLHFITGYNYNSTQTFIIERYKDETITELTRYKDLTSGRGGESFTCELCQLEEDTLYNVTVVSKNSRGESQGVLDSVKFSTYGKPKTDPGHTSNSTFKPRLGDTVSLTIQALGYPPPEYVWLHNGTQIKSSDTNYTSTVYLSNITVNDFGKYTLNMSNEAGYFAKVYQLLAEGPPAPVTNLNVSAVTTTTANLSFVTGYDYNKTQTFVVMRYENGNYTELHRVNDTHPDPGQQEFSFVVKNLSTNTEYNITVVSMNSNGTSTPAKAFVSFLTEGIPEPDPASPVVNTTAPRLGANTTFKVQAVGNPLPVAFTWWHNNVPFKHTDHGLTTMIEVHNVTEDDFGDYVLNMKNEIGNKNYTFTIKEDGPPDAVWNLSYSDITADSVELKWMAGFDYGSKQSFGVKGTVNDKELINIKDIDDTTGGRGGPESFKLEKLESSSSYNIYLVAKNARGSASKSDPVSFTTQAGSKNGKGTTAAEYVGYVMGGIGAIVFIIAIISVVRWCSKRRSEVPYEELPERPEEDAQIQPHHYRYDDAAAPSDL